MNITIKPYSQEYAAQCAQLERYLWKENDEERKIRFNWSYIKSPLSENPLCVIAVKEDDEVIGFRGYFLNKFLVNGREVLTAEICDTVVAPEFRRQGVFQKMNKFSLSYLKNNGVEMIIDLGPSWPPYHGNKKLGFEDLSHFHSKYKFGIISILKDKLFRFKRNNWIIGSTSHYNAGNVTYSITSEIDNLIISQIEKLDVSSKIHSSQRPDILQWRFSRPGHTYIYAYALDMSNNLLAFIMFSTNDNFNFQMGFSLYNNIGVVKRLFKRFINVCKPSTIAAWDFATDKNTQEFLRKTGFISLPFINKIRNNPPSLVRTLLTNEDGSLNWNIEGVDIRKVENWAINKFDLDSF